MSIAVVTDSTADIPADLLEKYSINVMPNIIVIDGHSLEDGIGISREEYYQRLPEMKSQPTTATASSGSYQVLYESLFHDGIEQVLSIHPSYLLSGILNAVHAAAQMFGDKVRVIDSGQVTLGLGFQVLEAAKARARGETLDKIMKRVEDVRKRTHFVALLDTLEFIRRSGRVSWARASLGSLLKIKPMIELKEGHVLRLGEARNRRNGIERLLHTVQDLGLLESLAILHTNAEQDARKFLDMLAPNVPAEPLIINVTTVIGTHVGPNALGYVAVTQ